MKSIFIVLDGLDGSGKGEMTKRLNDYLAKKGLKVLVTREPTDGKYGKEIRNILRQEKDPRSGAEKCLDLFVKDRKEHLVQDIEPFLKEENGVVICDRYYYSTIAFQQTQGIDVEDLIIKNMGFRTPDIAFILDLPVEMALERIDKRGEAKEKFEEISFMKELRQNFLNLKKSIADNINIIDASKTKDVVFDQIKKELDKLL
ncbi:MAG: dTMP kinase [Nanoarchaeota archaeon]